MNQIESTSSSVSEWVEEESPSIQEEGRKGQVIGLIVCYLAVFVLFL